MHFPLFFQMIVIVPRHHVAHFLSSGVDGRHAESLLNEHIDQIAA